MKHFTLKSISTFTIFCFLFSNFTAYADTANHLRQINPGQTTRTGTAQALTNDLRKETDRASRGAANREGLISASQHELIRRFLKDTEARSEKNRRRDLEARLLELFPGLRNMPIDVANIEVYSVPNLFKATGVKGHYAIRDGVVYVDREILEGPNKEIYLLHEVMELIYLRNWAFRQSRNFDELVKWLDKEGSEEEVREVLSTAHRLAVRLPAEDTAEIIEDSVRNGRVVRGAAEPPAITEEMITAKRGAQRYIQKTYHANPSKITPSEAAKYFEKEQARIRREEGNYDSLQALTNLHILRALQLRAVLAGPIVGSVNPVHYGWGGEGNEKLLGIPYTEADRVNGKYHVAENWMNSTQADHPSRVRGTALTVGTNRLPEIDLRELSLTRTLFLKTLATAFPAEISIGFNEDTLTRLRSENKDPEQEFINLLKKERDLVKRLYDLLQRGPCAENNQLFRKFREAYIAWAIKQAEGDNKWNKADTFPVDRYLPKGSRGNNLLEEIKAVRRALTSFSNNIPLTSGENIILVPTGTYHAIMGLSVQSHPKENIEQLGKIEHTKTEAWIYLPIYNSSGEIVSWVLVESQEVSNDTYSFADFFATFDWIDMVKEKEKDKAGRNKLGPGTRKAIMTDEELKRIVENGFKNDSFSKPEPLTNYVKDVQPTADPRVTLFVDDEKACKIFSTYRVTLSGTDSVDSFFGNTQHDLFVSRGTVEITVADKTFKMKAGEACVIDGEMGEYTITSTSDMAQVFVIGNPGAAKISRARRTAPRTPTASGRPARPPSVLGPSSVSSNEALSVLSNQWANRESIFKMAWDNINSWLKYVQIKLRFGTSGLRDFVRNMTDMEIVTDTLGFISYCEEQKELDKNSNDPSMREIYLSKDLRYSSPRLAKAIAFACEAAGYKAIFAGDVPTEVGAYYAQENGQRIFIMVTGSHIPSDKDNPEIDQNGVKFYMRGREVLNKDTGPIYKHIENARKVVCSLTSKDAAKIWDARNGNFVESVPDYLDYESIKQDDVEELFLKRADVINKFFIEFAKRVGISEERLRALGVDKPLRGVKVGVFKQTAVGADLLVKWWQRLGASVAVVDYDVEYKKFYTVDTEDMTPDKLETLREYAKREYDFVDENGKIIKGRPDTVSSGDGDTDRPVLTDEDGNFIGANVNLPLLNLLGIKSNPVPVSASRATIEALNRFGVKRYKSKIGSPVVVDLMDKFKKFGAAINNKIKDMPEAAKIRTRLEQLTMLPTYSFENNGGGLLGSEVTINGAMLKPLPTRDAYLPQACFVIEARLRSLLRDETAIKVSEVASEYEGYKFYAGLVDLVEPAHMAAFVARVKPNNSKINSARFLDDGRVEVTYYGEENLVTSALENLEGVLKRQDVDDDVINTAVTGLEQAIKQWLEGKKEMLETDNSVALELKEKRNWLQTFFAETQYEGEKLFSSITELDFTDGIQMLFRNQDRGHIRGSSNSPQFRFYADAVTGSLTPPQALKRAELMVEISTDVRKLGRNAVLNKIEDTIIREALAKGEGSPVVKEDVITWVQETAKLQNMLVLGSDGRMATMSKEVLVACIKDNTVRWAKLGTGGYVFQQTNSTPTPPAGLLPGAGVSQTPVVAPGRLTPALIAEYNAAGQRLLGRLEDIYKRDGSKRDDYYVPPMVAKSSDGRPIGTVKKRAILGNHRGDRMMELILATQDPNFNAAGNRFDTDPARRVAVTPFANYDSTLFKQFGIEPAFPYEKPEFTTLSDVLLANDIIQIRVAESDKGAHVTEFFDGRRSLNYEQLEKEGKIYIKPIPSEGKDDRDKAPEMRFRECAQAALEILNSPRVKDSGKRVFVFINLATDIVGHNFNGDKEKAKRAVLTTDEAVGIIRAEEQRLGADAALIVTSDHGNVEEMAVLDDATGQPLVDEDGVIFSKQHSPNNPVPFIVEGLGEADLKEGKSLVNIAATVADTFGIEAPDEWEESLLVDSGAKQNKKVVFVIVRDGWGVRTGNRDNPKADEWDAVKLANPPVDRDLMENCPNTLLRAHGDVMGLPDYQMGDSDNGHVTIGAGQIVPTVYREIIKQYEDGRFYENPVLLAEFERQMAEGEVHIGMMVSSGGIHSDYRYVLALLEMAKRLEVHKKGIPIFIHAILDGRDVQTRIPTQSGLYYLQEIFKHAKGIGLNNVFLADLQGRQYIMDRDARKREMAIGKARRELVAAEDTIKRERIAGDIAQMQAEATRLWNTRFKPGYLAWLYGQELDSGTPEIAIKPVTDGPGRSTVGSPLTASLPLLADRVADIIGEVNGRSAVITEGMPIVPSSKSATKIYEAIMATPDITKIEGIIGGLDRGILVAVRGLVEKELRDAMEKYANEPAPYEEHDWWLGDITKCEHIIDIIDNRLDSISNGSSTVDTVNNSFAVAANRPVATAVSEPIKWPVLPNGYKTTDSFVNMLAAYLDKEASSGQRKVIFAPAELFLQGGELKIAGLKEVLEMLSRRKLNNSEPEITVVVPTNDAFVAQAIKAMNWPGVITEVDTNFHFSPDRPIPAEVIKTLLSRPGGIAGVTNFRNAGVITAPISAGEGEIYDTALTLTSKGTTVAVPYRPARPNEVISAFKVFYQLLNNLSVEGEGDIIHVTPVSLPEAIYQEINIYLRDLQEAVRNI